MEEVFSLKTKAKPMIRVEFFGSLNLDYFRSNPKRQKNLKKKNKLMEQ